MREGWVLKTFEELSSKIGDGLHGTPKYDLNGDFFFVNGNNLNNGIIEIKEKTKRVNKSEYTKHFKNLTSNTVLVSINGTLGKVAFYNNEPIILGKSACYINLNGDVDKRFIKYHIQSPMFFKNMEKQATGATIKNFSLKSMRNYELSLPPLAEQQQIVAILDKAFTAIDTAKANIEKNIENAKELFQSKLNQIFSQTGEGWEEKTIEELTTLVTKGSSPKWQGIEYVDEDGVFFLTSKNVGEGELILHNKKYLEEKFNEIQKKSILNKGDVLTNIVGASIGRTAVFDLNELTNINQAVCLMRCDDSLLHNYYLMYMLNSPYFKKILHDNEVDNARANLSLTFFKKLVIQLPTVVEQIRIVEEIKEIKIEISLLTIALEKKLNNIKELKKSILQKAFAGELTNKEVTV